MTQPESGARSEGEGQAQSREVAGREIDRRVHVEVMGKAISVLREFDYAWTGKTSRMVRVGVPKYSTDIAAAMGVVREMQKRGHDFEGGVIGHAGAYAKFREYERPQDVSPNGMAAVDPGPRADGDVRT